MKSRRFFGFTFFFIYIKLLFSVIFTLSSSISTPWTFYLPRKIPRNLPHFRRIAVSLLLDVFFLIHWTFVAIEAKYWFRYLGAKILEWPWINWSTYEYIVCLYQKCWIRLVEVFCCCLSLLFRVVHLPLRSDYISTSIYGVNKKLVSLFNLFRME